MRRLNGITSSRSLSKLGAIVKNREAYCGPSGHKESDMI